METNKKLNQMLCDHNIIFDLDAVQRLSLTPQHIKIIYPRLFGKCPKGCGFDGIAYASKEHYVYGDF